MSDHRIRVVILATAVLTLLALGGARVSADSDKSASEPQPKIELLNPVYDFGTVLEGQSVSHTFQLKNNGQGDLIISRVQTSCGCTAAEPSTKHLKPGEQSDVSVTFDTRHQKGHRTRTITVFSNDPQMPNAVMTLQGDVKVEVDAVPSEVNFDQVTRGSEQTKQVEVSDLAGAKDFKVGPVTNSSPNIKITQLPPAAGKRGALLNVALLKTMPIGPFDDTIEILTNRQPLQVHVFGRVVGDLVLDPAQISFGIVPHGQGMVRYLRLINSSSKPLQIVGVSSSSQSVGAKVDALTPGKEFKVIVELRKGTPDGQLRGQVAIKTDNPEQQTLTVPFYAIVGSFEG